MESGWWVIIYIYRCIRFCPEFAAVAVMVFGCYSMCRQVVDSKRGCER